MNEAHGRLTQVITKGIYDSVVVLKGFLGGAVAVPPLANVGVGVTIPTKAQQKWPGSGPVDWLKHQSYGCNIE
uniref:Uncharacterized protein n=1 Tax=Romanomermis culicivorax TaxID=13658 RepID=A0A915KCV9_ROMCU